jgi:cytochrome c-type biogenesis protein CcmF
VTLSGAYYSHIAVPIGVFLLLLTGLGPLLAWRASSFRSIAAEFCAAGDCVWVTADCADRGGAEAVADEGVFYSLMTFSLAAAVATAVLRSFCAALPWCIGRRARICWLRCAADAAQHAAVWRIHGSLWLVIIFIGFAGYAFNRSGKSDGPGDTMEIGPYTLKNLGNTQESNPNYDSEFSLLDVYENGKKILDQPMAPEKRVYSGEWAAADDGGESLDDALGSVCGV